MEMGRNMEMTREREMERERVTGIVERNVER
jgi:hypothetical protein